MTKVPLSEIFAKLPPEWSEDLSAEIKSILSKNQEILVVIDDDPTGSQAVHDIPLLTEWGVEALTREINKDLPAFFILTNTRSMPPERAVEINREIGRNLHEISLKIGKKIVVVSRGDSTLRGHFPDEMNALSAGLQTAFDAWLIVPALPGEGRYTINDIHYVTIGDALAPVGFEQARERLLAGNSDAISSTECDEGEAAWYKVAT